MRTMPGALSWEGRRRVPESSRPSEGKVTSLDAGTGAVDVGAWVVIVVVVVVTVVVVAVVDGAPVLVVVVVAESEHDATRQHTAIIVMSRFMSPPFPNEAKSVLF
jgi:hypothetical protein